MSKVITEDDVITVEKEQDSDVPDEENDEVI